MSAVDIKNAIKADLDQLVDYGVLGGATITDLKKDPLASDIPTFPHAFVMPPAMESENIDNRTIARTYTYSILVLWKAENIADTTTVETGLEQIMLVFDNDPTLGGTAMAGIMPVSSAPEPFQHAGHDLIAAQVQIQAKQLVQLTF